MIHYYIILLSVSALESDVMIRGRGSDYAAPILKTLGALYSAERAPFKSVHASYASGSGKSECLLAEQCEHLNDSVEYVAHSYMKINRSECGEDLLSFPLMAGPIVIVYNLPMSELVLDIENIADIFSGNISHWNDSRLTRMNDGLPDKPISTVARQCLAGQTFAFTFGLSTAVEYWLSEFGAFGESNAEAYLNSTWPEGAIKFYARGAIGMVGIVRSVAYSIGYVDYAHAIQHDLKVATIVARNRIFSNREEIYAGISAVLNERVHWNENAANETTTAVRLAYPFVMTIYFLVNQSKLNEAFCDQQLEFMRFIDWIISSPLAKDIASQNGVVLLSSHDAMFIGDTKFRHMTCAGVKVYETLQSEKARETYKQQEWKLILLIVITVLLLLGTTGLASVQLNRYWTLRQKIKSRVWILSSSDMTEDDALYQDVNPFPASRDCTDWDHLLIHQKTFIYNNFRVIGFASVLPLSQVRIKQQSYITGKRVQHIIDNFKHENVHSFYGLIWQKQSLFFVHVANNTKGTIRYILQKYRNVVEINVRLRMALDVCKGMAYLHQHGILHGGLASINCLVDANWHVQVSDWLQRSSFDGEISQATWASMLKEKFDHFADLETPNFVCVRLLLAGTDPELLSEQTDQRFEAPHDVYSFGILGIQIFSPEEAYGGMTDGRVSALIYHLSTTEELPPIPMTVPDRERLLLKKCLRRDKTSRPTFLHIIKLIQDMLPKKQTSIIETLMHSMQQYTANLEAKIHERTADLKRMTTNCEELLENMLPKEIAVKLRNGEQIVPEYFEEVSVYFSDIVGFTNICHGSTPFEVVQFLNHLYTGFDETIDRFDVYKVETIGDAYIVASGLPRKNGQRHAREIAALALQIMNYVDNYKIRHTGQKLQIRIGINSGPCMAGIVGLKMPRYCLFGDTVNTASRMESTSLPMRIQASEKLVENLRGYEEFSILRRGTTTIKGKGKMTTYWISASNPGMYKQLGNSIGLSSYEEQLDKMTPVQ